jgi:hypothetical protein
MPQFVRRWKTLFWLLLWGAFVVPVHAAVTDDFLNGVTGDYDAISSKLNSELGRVFGFYSTLGWNDGPSGLDLISGPHVEFGADLGLDFVKIDSKSIPLSVLSPGSNVDIPSSIPFPYPVWHARVGVFKGFDIGMRATGYPRIHKDQISTANHGFGFALRYEALHGMTLPDVSVQVTWDRMKGDASFATDIDQQTTYTDGGTPYNATLTGQTLYQEIWDVRSFGLKVMVGKTVGIFHPYGAVGLQRYAGQVQSRLGMDLTGTIEGFAPQSLSASPLVRSANPPITQPKFMVGFELGTGFYWSNLFETNGRDYAFSTGFRGKI